MITDPKMLVEILQFVVEPLPAIHPARFDVDDDGHLLDRDEIECDHCSKVISCNEAGAVGFEIGQCVFWARALCGPCAHIATVLEGEDEARAFRYATAAEIEAELQKFRTAHGLACPGCGAYCGSDCSC